MLPCEGAGYREERQNIGRLFSKAVGAHLVDFCKNIYLQKEHSTQHLKKKKPHLVNQAVSAHLVDVCKNYLGDGFPKKGTQLNISLHLSLDFGGFVDLLPPGIVKIIYAWFYP